MVVAQVITAGVKWVLSLLNPASAFVKAAMAIYDIVMFFVNRGSQILDLVNAVIDAVAAIANGAIGGAAKLVEDALAKSLPVVIGFLASLLGIGDLAKKVEKIIEKIRDRIDQAIDKLLAKAKSLFKGKGGKANKGGENHKTEPGEAANHKALAKQAVSELEQSGATEKDYITLRKEKELQAKQIEQTYTKKLKPGIKLSVKFDNNAKLKQNQDLRFKVIIAPNTTEEPGSVPCLNWDCKSQKTFGHTFNKHGAGSANTKKLRGRAAGTKQNQGQWLDNEKAAKFLQDIYSKITIPNTVEIPPGLGQVIHPDGTVESATHAMVVPKQNGGYRTAYPVIPENKP